MYVNIPYMAASLYYTPTSPPKNTPPKSNDGLENVSPFKHAVILGIYVRFQGAKHARLPNKKGPLTQEILNLVMIMEEEIPGGSFRVHIIYIYYIHI